MNRFLWNICSKLNLKKNTKKYVFLVTASILAGIIGLICWFILKNYLPILKNIGWIICVIGYPMVIAYISGMFYLFKHE